MTTLTIPKEMTRKGDLVIIPRREYERILDLGKKIIRKKVKPVSELDKRLEKALKEVREGKTIGPFNTVEEGIKFLKSDKVK